MQVIGALVRTARLSRATLKEDFPVFTKNMICAQLFNPITIAIPKGTNIGA